MQIDEQMNAIGEQARKAASWLAMASKEQKNQALQAMAAALAQGVNDVLLANAKDVAGAKERQLPKAFIDRLLLNEARVSSIVQAVRDIAALPDPVGKELAQWTVPSGLNIRRVATPLGVIGVIYESRPNVTADAAALCFKAGNAVILRGGSECTYSNRAILSCLQQGLLQSGAPAQAVQALPGQDRAMVGKMLRMSEYIDVIIPRGGASLVKRVSEESRIPLFYHLQGICHSYVHASADPAMALEVVLNAKMRRTGICGATETVLVDADIAPSFLPALVQKLADTGCEVRGCGAAAKICPTILSATEADWSTEYLDAIVSIKIVSGMEEAIAHIQQYSSSHTEAILAKDEDAVAQFMRAVDSSIVMHNASTQFADGGEFGMGAEIGISTGRMHARGPVGVEQLTTFQYQVKGHGHTRP